MKVESRLFGELEVSGEAVVTFPSGLPGFETLRQFVVLPVPGTHGALEWLQSIEEPGVGLPLIDPSPYFVGYELQVDEADLNALGLSAVGEGVARLVVSIPADVREMTANLRAPVVFNPFQRIGRQILLFDDKLAVRAPVFAR